MRFHMLDQLQLGPLRPWTEIVKQSDLKAGSYAAGLELDSGVCKGRIDRIVCAASLPNLHSIISERIFKRALGTNRDPLRHLLFKAWPVRCWTRKFWTVLTRFIKADKTIDVLVHRLLLCSLLGNYPHISTARPGLAIRKRLYELLDAEGHREQYASESSAAWRHELVERCPRVYLHAIQEYMCADIDSNPVLAAHVQNMMPFRKFFNIVQKMNARFRNTLSGPACTVPYDDLSGMLETTRQEILGISYDLPHLPFFEFLREVKSFAKPSAALWLRNSGLVEMGVSEFKVDAFAKPSTEISKCLAEEDDSDAEEQPAKISRAERNPASRKVLIEQAVQQGLNRSMKRTAGTESGKIPMTAMQITMDHSRALESFIEHAMDSRATTPDDAFWAITGVMHLFGCTEVAISELRMMWVDYNLVKRAKDRWKACMAAFNLRFPYAYALIHAARRFFARHKSVQTYPLPSNIMQAQVAAVKQAHGGHLFQEACYFLACPCCRTPATLVRSGATPDLNSVDGLRGVVTDLATGRVLCGRTATFGHRQCGQPGQEMARILALGQWIGFKRRGIVLCCHCGDATRIEPEHCIYDEKGLACCKCTKKLRKTQYQQWLKSHPELSDRTQFKCLLCNMTLAAKRDFIYLAKDTFACHRHPHRTLNRLLQTFEERAPADVQADLFKTDTACTAAKKLLILIRTELKREQEKSSRKKNDHVLKLLHRAEANRNQR